MMIISLEIKNINDSRDIKNKRRSFERSSLIEIIWIL